MIAATYTQTGAANVMSVRELPTPEPGPREVRVRLQTAGVNPTDWKLRSGLTALAPLGDADAETPVRVPGQDGAGVVDAIGAQVSEFAVGERVWTLLAGAEGRLGTAAQFVVVPTDRLAPLPDDASFELGASLGVPALTASYCLSDREPVAGKVVLISGGAGAVGNAAIALAKFEGAASVVATVSGPEKGELARAAGADVVVNYRDADAAAQIRRAAPSGVDLIVEVDLAANLELDLAVLKNRSRVVCYAANPTTAVELPVRRIMAVNASLEFMVLYNVPESSLAAAVTRTGAAVAAGALRVTLPSHHFPLGEVAAAHDAVQQGAVGKVFLDIPQD